jgi:hypothetical protein
MHGKYLYGRIAGDKVLIGVVIDYLRKNIKLAYSQWFANLR